MAILLAQWQMAFMKTVQRHRNAVPLRDAAVQGRLGAWTETLTGVVVDSCGEVGWQAAAKWQPVPALPVQRNEYLALDVMAFLPGEARWRFPVAVFELENSKDDERIAYSLWKVLCVRAELRVVFCYRQNPGEGPGLVHCLRDKIIGEISIPERMALGGQVALVVGSRNEADTFPYGFFKWWRLDTNTGKFELV